MQEAILMDPAKRESLPADDVAHRVAAHHLRRGAGCADAALAEGRRATRYNELKKQLAAFDSIKPAPRPVGQFMTDISANAPPIHTLKNGNVQAKGDAVQPGFLSILAPGDASITPPEGLNSTGRRSVLAAWLTDPEQPADRACDGQSDLALPLRPRHRGHAGRLRTHGRKADASSSCSTISRRASSRTGGA